MGEKVFQPKACHKNKSRETKNENENKFCVATRQNKMIRHLFNAAEWFVHYVHVRVDLMLVLTRAQKLFFRH